MDEYLANIAMQGTPDDMLEAARYFQTLPMQEDRAILLYHKVTLRLKKTFQSSIFHRFSLGRFNFESHRFGI